jgi:hypothetical protein
MDLGFLRTNIGYVILGSLVSTVASVLALRWELFALLAVLAGLFAFGALWHIGWRLAFPPRLGSRAPEAWMLVIGGLAAAGLGAAVLAGVLL